MKWICLVGAFMLGAAGCESVREGINNIGKPSPPRPECVVDVKLPDPDGGETTVQVIASPCTGSLAEGVRHMQLGDWTDADKSLTAALADGKREPAEIFAAAVLYEKMERYQEAIALYREANQIPGNENRADIRDGKLRCEAILRDK